MSQSSQASLGSIDGKAPPWLSMERLTDCHAHEFGGRWYLQCPRRRELVSSLQMIKGLAADQVTAKFSPFLRWWSLQALTPTGVEMIRAMLAQYAFQPMPASWFQTACDLVGSSAENRRFQFGYDNYRLRFVRSPELMTRLRRLDELLGVHAHLEWEREGCQLYTRANAAHRSIRSLLIREQFALWTDFLVPSQSTPASNALIAEAAHRVEMQAAHSIQH